MLAAVELFEPGADVGQPDAPPGPDLVVPIHAPAIVPYFQLQEAIVRSTGSGDLHPPWLDARRDAMADGVLHQRLQDQMGHACIQRLWRDVHHDRQPVLQARLLDLEVGLEKGELLAQRHLLRLLVLEGGAQEVAEAGDHSPGGLRFGGDERRDRVQRVEEEVRLQLHLERLQPRLGEAPRQLLRCLLALAIAPVVEHEVCDAEEERIEEDVLAGRSPELRTEGAHADPRHVPAQHDHDAGARERDDDGSDEVHRDPPEHSPPLEGKAAGQPEDGEGGERPEDGFQQGGPQGHHPGHLPPAQRRQHVLWLATSNPKTAQAAKMIAVSSQSRRFRCSATIRARF